MAGINIAADSLNYTSTTPVHALGQTCEVDGTIYRYVYNTSATTTITAYYAAYKRATSSYYVDGTTGSGINALVGFVHTALGPNEYGWMAIEGFHTAYAMAAIGTIGYPLACGATPGVNTYTQAPDRCVGWAAQLTTAAGTFAMYVKV